MTQKAPMNFVQMKAFVVPAIDYDHSRESGMKYAPCHSRDCVVYQAWGWEREMQAWKFIAHFDCIDEAEAAAREWHEMDALAAGDGPELFYHSNETLMADVEELRAFEAKLIVEEQRPLSPS